MRSLLSREASVPMSRGCPPSPLSRGVCAAFVLLIVPLAGCTLGAPKQAAVPPAPKPAVVQAAAPDPPLSIPQTAVTLPDLQKVSPDAIPTAQAAAPPVPEKTEAPAPPHASRHAAAGPSSPPKAADSEPEAEAPPVQAVQEQAPIQPIMKDDEQKKIKNDIDARKKEINEKLGRVKGRALSEQNQSLGDHILSFLAQCEVAAARGDYSQADSLSERALVLAREIQIE